MNFRALRWKRFFHSIFTRVIGIGLIVVLIGCAARYFIISNVLRNDIETLATTQQRTLSSHVAHDIDQKIKLRQETLHRLAQSLPPDLLDKPEDLKAWLRERHELIPIFSYGLSVEDNTGRIIANYPERPTPFHTVATEKLEQPLIGHTANGSALSIAVPIGPVDGKAHAILRGITTLTMPGFFDQLDLYQNGKSGEYILIFPRERLFLAASDSSATLNPLPSGGIKASNEGQEEISALTLVPSTGWSVVSRLPTHEVYFPVQRALKLVSYSFPLTMVVFLLLAGPALFFMLRPLTRAADHADRMTRGEIPLEPLPIVFHDEYGDLTAAFNRLINKVSDKTKELTIQKEIAETATLAKSRFLAAASHDLRQPMYALNLYLGALGNIKLPEAARPVLTSVRHCAQTMDDMFSALLDISRLDASVMKPKVSGFPISVLFGKIEMEFTQQAQAKGLTLRVAVCSAHVLSDPDFLERILRNLVSNAVRYTEHGKILVGCRRTATGLRLAVYDTGIGIPFSHQRVIFDEFHQVGNPERDRAQGLGLGLAIVQRLADLLDAPLKLKSRLWRGSVFSIELPRVPTSSAKPLLATTSYSRHQGALASSFIVVIDDEMLILDATRVLLEQWGCIVATATSGSEALDLLGPYARIPDAIVCDYRLRGGETGSEVISALRDEFNCDIPALLVTGDTSPERIKALLTSGFPILHKPLQDQALMNALSLLIN